MTRRAEERAAREGEVAAIMEQESPKSSGRADRKFSEGKENGETPAADATEAKERRARSSGPERPIAGNQCSRVSERAAVH